MPLTPGDYLGPYQVTSKIGQGGMGEVYRAKDTRLDRDVAIKVLSEALVRNSSRLSRFEREAKVLAALNHPNIAAIYGLERSADTPALVLELVEGPTLADRVAHGPIPVQDALRIARQIAEAIEAAHELGVVHRDLKPANVKVRPDGIVKVLDFGLAKAFLGALRDPSESPDASATTEPGAILGTPGYLSPEQLYGEPLDRRADIWAFGCVLYELLSGKRAFHARNASDVAAVIERAPDWHALPADVPVSVRRLLRRCLEKDPKRRLQHIGDARVEIEESLALSSTDLAAELGVERRAVGGHRASHLAIVALATGLIVGLAVWRFAREPLPPPSEPITRFPLVLPQEQVMTSSGRRLAELSPDGTHLAYTANGQLYLRAMDRMEATPMSGTSGAQGPFFSPDGQWIGFWQGGQLKKVAIGGGAPVTLCEVTASMGASWGPDDTILFGQLGTGILKVRGEGGRPEVVISIPAESGEVARQPQMLPGGKAVLFTLSGGLGEWNQGRVVMQFPETGERRVLVEGGTDAGYVATGHLLYVQGHTLFARPFDRRRLEITGGPVSMIEGVAQNSGSGVAQFSASSTGSLVYVPDTAGESARTLVWVNRDGREEVITRERRPFDSPRLAPDSRRIAVGIREDNIDIWVYDLVRGNLTRLTSDAGEDESPLWTPDGRHITFAASRAGVRVTLQRPMQGSGSEHAMPIGQHRHHHLGGWSPDGRTLAFTSLEASADIWLATAGDEAGARPFLQTAASEQAPVISPNGRWLAYASTETGRSEIYVQAFPGGGFNQQISTDGGTEPLWSASRSELFFRNGDQMVVVEVGTEPKFSASRPHVLFERRYEHLPWNERNYDVTPDGRRFLMVKGEAAPKAAHLVLVLNWFEELKRRVPTTH
jgi:serine/threonine-protein kinase